MSGDDTAGSADRTPSVVETELPAADFALAETFETVPGVSFRCEPVVTSGDGTAAPLVWAYGADREAVDRALAADPSVDDAAVVAAAAEDLLYRVDWGERPRLVFEMLTTPQGTVLHGTGVDGTWTFRLLYPDRKALSRVNRFCDDREIDLDIRSIREMEGRRAGRFGLTAEQYEALRAARERGYFAVPREVELEDLADALDISHQALSERLRRARDTLVRGAVLSDPPERGE